MKEFLIVHTGSYVGAVYQSKCPVISYAPKEKFVDFCRSLKESYPDFRLRGVCDEKIETIIKRKIAQDAYKMLVSAKQR